MKLTLALAAVLLAVPTVAAREAPNLGVGYICGAETAAKPAGSVALVRLPGMGTGSLPADTANPEAKAWFDYGLQLFHAFYHEEAKQAFAKAAELDPKCAACAWGVSLSHGATLNTFASVAEARTAADRADRLASPSDARLRGLIDAAKARYKDGVSGAERELAFGRALDDVWRQHPDDLDIASLAAHAMLIPARAQNYTGVARAEELLEGVLARRPDDTAAIHYYIHATEFGGHAREALPYAERLAGLAPSASHLVHMGAHTMMRVGQYQDVAVTNAAALKVDSVQKAQGYANAATAQRYYAHNFQFGLAGALMSGDRALALKYADHGAKVFPTLKGEERAIFAQARGYVALGRYAPARALEIPEDKDLPRIVRLYRHYARGEAAAALRDAAAAEREAKAIAALGEEAGKAGDSNAATVAAIAADVVSGRAAMAAGDPDRAAAHFAKAADRQKKDFPVYDNFDPPPWWYPVRRSLAAAHLKAGRNVTAAREARQSLVEWPQDALALRVLAEAEAAMGQKDAARTHAAEAKRHWQGDLAQIPIDLT